MKRMVSLLEIVAVSLFCFVSQSTAADGFGQYTTGGAGGTIVTVDNATDFIYYVQGTKQTPYIIYVSGNINLGGSNIRVRGNKTIIGLPESHITGNLKCFRSEESNNIFRFLDMDNDAGAGDGDCISIDGVNNIWVDHCTFTDGGDGNVDIKNGADYVTVSWCIFQYTYDSGHNFSNLVGHSDDNGSTDMGHLLVTFHHNWYSTLCHERMPSVRFGKAHIFNNYFNSTGNNYCIRTRLYAQCLVENNYFKDVQNPWQRYVTSAGGDPGLLYASGNILDNITWNVSSDSSAVLIDGTDTVFTPTYVYTLDNAEDVPAIVQYGAGANGKDGYPPHWLLGYYGDFDISGFVDMNDFAEFANYWGITDCSQLSNADYNNDCKVDFYELALLTENWLYIPLDTTAPAAPTDFWALGGNGTVPLEWNDNNEPDFAGYNIYRSTTSGSGYTKLNGSLLTDSSYTDNTVTNGTIYYYLTTANDTTGNESADSVEACAKPGIAANIMLQENATGFCGVDGAIENEWTGYTGAGYVNTTNATVKGVDWKISVPSSGTYSFVWRYASASADRAGTLFINGSAAIPSISFPASGAWATYIESSTVDISLSAGINSIRLEATTSDGLANIDYLNIIGINPQAESCQ